MSAKAHEREYRFGPVVVRMPPNGPEEPLELEKYRSKRGLKCTRRKPKRGKK